MEDGALLGIIEEAGIAVLTLAEGIEKREFLASRLTRSEVRRQLAVMASAAAGLLPAAREGMPELAWAQWDGLKQALLPDAGEADEAMWQAVGTLVPATLMWLRVYRQNQPALFALGA